MLTVEQDYFSVEKNKSLEMHKTISVILLDEIRKVIASITLYVSHIVFALQQSCKILTIFWCTIALTLYMLNKVCPVLPNLRHACLDNITHHLVPQLFFYFVK